MFFFLHLPLTQFLIRHFFNLSLRRLKCIHIHYYSMSLWVPNYFRTFKSFFWFLLVNVILGTATPAVLGRWCHLHFCRVLIPTYNCRPLLMQSFNIYSFHRIYERSHIISLYTCWTRTCCPAQYTMNFAWKSKILENQNWNTWNRCDQFWFSRILKFIEPYCTMQRIVCSAPPPHRPLVAKQLRWSPDKRMHSGTSRGE